MNVGDTVKMAPIGKIIKITKEYVVVRWEGVNGDWHYTEQQAERLEVINEQV